MDEGAEKERRGVGRISDAEVEAIAKRAACIVEDNFTLQIGKIAIRVFLYIFGASGAAVLAWLGLAGHIK